MFVIEAMNGPLDGKRWVFDEAIGIGRDASLVQAVVSTDRTISRKHAEVRKADGAFALSDLGSSNGTFVDGQRIERSALRPGQPFVVGRTMLRVLEIADVT